MEPLLSEGLFRYLSRSSKEKKEEGHSPTEYFSREEPLPIYMYRED